MFTHQQWGAAQLPIEAVMPRPYRRSRPGLMGLWAAWFSFNVEVGGPACVRGWRFVILGVPSKLGHSVILFVEFERMQTGKLLGAASVADLIFFPPLIWSDSLFTICDALLPTRSTLYFTSVVLFFNVLLIFALACGLQRLMISADEERCCFSLGL